MYILIEDFKILIFVLDFLQVLSFGEVISKVIAIYTNFRSQHFNCNSSIMNESPKDLIKFVRNEIVYKLYNVTTSNYNIYP